jgi:hypothetical protein
VDLAREPARDPRHGLELLAARSHEALRGAEVGEQRALSDRAAGITGTMINVTAGMIAE